MELALRLFQFLLLGGQLIAGRLDLAFDAFHRGQEHIHVGGGIDRVRSGVFLLQIQVLHDDLDAAFKRRITGGRCLPGAWTKVLKPQVGAVDLMKGTVAAQHFRHGHEVLGRDDQLHFAHRFRKKHGISIFKAGFSAGPGNVPQRTRPSAAISAQRSLLRSKQTGLQEER
ncbi:MAG TPA: hypothetical protein VGJ22_02820, partial [Anaerolineales bacterium]